MKKLFIILACAAAIAACSDGKYGKGVPAEYEPLLDSALQKAGDNAPNLLTALEQSPEEQREGMAYLISYMPDGDLDTLNTSLLLDNVDYAYMARKKYEWAKTLPDSIFFNDVLPYAVIDETRENWRKDFFNRFGARIEGMTDVREAVTEINRNINVETGVEYDTRREKTNQSPYESMRQGMASCTGLAVLLVDAFRSVGIPARFAGTASWYDDRGNHSWVEVWIEGEWYITEFYMPAELNKPWFTANAGKADPSKRQYAIYATSFAPTGDYFPMVWAKESQAVHGVNVSQRYVDIAQSIVAKANEEGTHTTVGLRMFKDKAHKSNSGDRVAVNVDVFMDDMQMDGGRTAGPHQDMNDVLTFFLEKGREYTFRYQGDTGPKEVKFTLGEEPLTVDAYMK